MAGTRAAYRYALALIGVAEERKELDAVTRDVDQLSALLKASKEFHLFMKSPVISRGKKIRLIEELLKGKLGETMYGFVRLMTAKGRETILSEITQEYGKLLDLRLGMVNATVRTAVPFSKEQEQNLSAKLQQVTGKNIRLRYIIDPALLGGFSVQYGDTVWDGSVRHQLTALRERLVAGAS